VVERRPEFVVVEKLGEAREQIDRDQPQQDDRTETDRCVPGTRSD
jgi:hypothetical protein